MAINFRVDFPPDVVAQREQALDEIRQLLACDTLASVRAAIRIQVDWLDRYPNDYVMWDAGELLAMSEDAILATEPEPALASVR
ncbi:MAG: hypothetical protein M3Y28_03230 [Armatimonadota bacterium]|nr:hypothetical protein [Armatimonadota bacterium]